MNRVKSIAVFASVGCAFAACRPEARWLRVERVDPSGASAVVPIAVNQELVVYFSDAIDPFTVTRESVRVRDARGHPVAGDLEVRSRSVRFRPRAPITPELVDGSFRPGETYRLEVTGMPTSYAVRSRSGLSLETGFAALFRVPTDPAELGLPTPFLPVGAGVEPLRLDFATGGPPRIAADAGVLELRFSLPLLPSSVRAAAFHVWRARDGGRAPEELAPLRVAVVPGVVPGARHPGSTVRLEFERSARLAPGDSLYLGLGEGADAPCDYRGRSAERPVGAIPIKVDPGDRVRVRDLDLSELRLEREEDAPLGFEVRAGRVVARAFVEAGTGADGALVAGPGTRIEVGGSFDRGDGTLVAVGESGLELTGISVPAGAELRLRIGAAGLLVRVCGDVRIDGRLVIEGAGREFPWHAGDFAAIDAMVRGGGATLVIGGDFVVGPDAEVVADGTPEAGPPIAVVTGGDVRIDGVVPPGCAFALREGREFHGVAEGVVRLRDTLTPGLPTAVALSAAAWTEWLPLPIHAGSIDLSVFDPRNGVQAWLQVAPPHSIVAGRPLVEREFVTPPLSLPLSEPIVVPQGAFFRVGLRGVVRGGDLPSIAGFALHDR